MLRRLARTQELACASRRSWGLVALAVHCRAPVPATTTTTTPAAARARSHYSWPSSSGPAASARRPASDDTIYALSTAHGRAGIAVVRISGPSCLDVYRALCPLQKLPRPRYAALRSLHAPDKADPDADILDPQALVILFPGPRTVTGQDVLELHLHGGPATVRAVLAAIARCPSPNRIRHAEPGEFTRRAFANGRLDLAQVEALGDALAAETEQQRRAAVRGNSGALGRTYELWRHQLLLARGEMEALIDFSEDQHFDEHPAHLLANVAHQVRTIVHSIHLHQLGGQRSELVRAGIRIALLGPPNVGKSSLMNLIVGRQASIVSGEAGTTRDVVEANLDLHGFLCCFADTAGFRSIDSANALGVVEAEGIKRARQKAQESDIILVLASIERGQSGPFVYYDEEALQLAAAAEKCLVLVNKRDMVDQITLSKLLQAFGATLAQTSKKLVAAPLHVICCRQGEQTPSNGADASGVESLAVALVDVFSNMTKMPPGLEDALGVTVRQSQLLGKCRQHLEDFAAEAHSDEGFGGDIVLAAEHLRYAADSLARLTGRGEAGDVEDVLGVVFEKFCVGK
ncbi:hypothetical protein CDD82_3192 [Ophiocordyceps australis]|uniref:TrmE-type G domain-containing protein n=1 Tax=Ophiocordyceps australis TaxID=1399860 RepID=A0A2C5ZEB6_9HYPO|nr:hypothetical protein CDD82_3192 [Ophiocordyceps australis]